MPQIKAQFAGREKVQRSYWKVSRAYVSAPRLTRAFVFALILLSVLGCESTLLVEPYASGSESEAGGVPFYLPQHEFVVTDLALDSDGKEVMEARRGLTVALVTRPDQNRSFVIKNNTGPFSASEFAIARDQQGRITAVFGKADDQSLETVQAIASFVATAAAFALLVEDDAAREALLKEKRLLEDKTIPLLLSLLEDAETAKEVKEIHDALNSARARLSAIEAALLGNIGTKAFGEEPANVHVCSNEDDRKRRLATLKEEEVGVYILLVPVVAQKGDGTCGT